MGTSAAGLTRVAVWGGGSDVHLETWPLPSAGHGEVLVRVSLATVCGSDLHTVSGRRSSPTPSVLGHEAVGEVVAVGETGARTVTGQDVVVGDRVVWGVAVACGRCDRCAGGRSAKCRSVRKVGHEATTSGWPLSGGYAEHVLLPAGSALVRVPHEVPDAVAAPAACATATVMAATEAAGDLAGRRVLVCGAGMLGLTASAVAAALGAREVVVTDPDPARRVTALAFGATSTLATDEPAPLTDVALDFSGSSAAVERALAALDVGGRLVLAGSVAPSPPVPLDPERVVRSWLTVTGVHNYEPRHLDLAVEFLARSADAHPWTSLVADPVPLARVGELLTRTGPSPTSPRTSVVP